VAWAFGCIADATIVPASATGADVASERFAIAFGWTPLASTLLGETDTTGAGDPIDPAATVLKFEISKVVSVKAALAGVMSALPVAHCGADLLFLSCLGPWV